MLRMLHEGLHLLCVIVDMFSGISAVGLLLMLVSLPNVCCDVCHVLLLLGHGGADKYCLSLCLYLAGGVFVGLL